MEKTGNRQHQHSVTQDPDVCQDGQHFPLRSCAARRHWARSLL